jgi:hypothetical protein
VYLGNGSFPDDVTSEDNDEFDQMQRREVKENCQQLQQLFLNPITNGTDQKQGSETPLLASDQFSAPAHHIAADNLVSVKL